MFNVGKNLSVLLVSLITPISVVFSPIVSYSTPPTTFQTLNSPTRLWLMTPEDDERCRQDTERYNAAWTAAWYASHPGQGPAPTPTPPYVCPPPPPDNTPTPVTPTPVTPNKPIVPGTNQGKGLPNELENKPGNTPELNTGLGKPGEYKPGYDPATGLPVNEAGQAAPDQPTYDTNNPLAPQPMQTPEPFRPDLQTPPSNPDTSKWIVPPAEEPHLPQATLPTQPTKPPAPNKPEIIPDKPVDTVDNGSYTPPANNQPQDTGSLNPTKKPINKIENNEDDNGYNYGGDNPSGRTKFLGVEMNNAEKGVCRANMFDCARSSHSPKLAEEESSKYFPGKKTDDNQQDAARHCIWLALMTEEANADFARKMSNAHEIGSPGGDGTPSGEMDRHNNETGINVGLRHEGDHVGLINECVTLARGATLVPTDNIPKADGETLIILTRRRN